MISTFAYYCSSPFNIILVFFKDNLLLGYHFVFCVKMIMAAFFFAVLLNTAWPNVNGKVVVLFSVSYPFMGYVIGYAWNQSWMDGVIFLPLILVGILNIVQKRRPALYIVILALSLFANFYIGYMLCIASVILFASVIFLKYKNIDKQIMKNALLFIGASLLAVALVAILLIPTYFGLPEGREQSIFDIIKNMAYRCRPEDILSMAYGNSMRGMGYLYNYPFIYVGIFQFVLVVIFFINKQISQRVKTVASVVITVFIISFTNSVLDIIWHGLSQNVGFNYRYSFILSFVLELIAFYSFIHIQEAERQLLLAGACLGMLTVLMMGRERENVSASVLLADLILILSMLFFLHRYIVAITQNNKRGNLYFTILSMLAVGSIIGNSITTIKEMEEKIGIPLASEYKEALYAECAIQEMILEDGFYRRASSVPFGRCDAMLFGYNGVQNYASTENLHTLQAAKKLGIEHTWMWGSYTENVPMSADVFLGIKYVTSKLLPKQKDYILEGQISKKEQDLYVLKNEHAMPLVFPVESEFHTENWGENPFDFLNNCWNSVTQEGGNIFYEIQYEKEDMVTNSGKDINIRFVAEHGHPIYMYIPTGEITVENVSNGELLEYSKNQDIVYVGAFSEGETVEIAIHVTGTYEGEKHIAIRAENQDILIVKAQDVLQKEIHINKESSSRLSMEYCAGQSEVLSSTIPYDEGWRVYIDGQKVFTKKNMNSFLSFDCPKGQHEIKFIYEPKGFKAGSIVSGVTILLLLLFAVFSRKQEDTNVRKEHRRNRYGKTK